MGSTITIGLPVYNSARSVLETIRSVFAQTYTDWRLVILDDCSTDGTLNLVSAITDPRVTVIRGTENRGLAARLNELAALAETPLLARLDADDLNHPDRLAVQVAYLDAHPHVDFVVADGISIDADSRPRGYRISSPAPSVDEHFLYGPYIHSVVTGRTAWFRANPYDSSLLRAEDQDLWLRTMETRCTVAQQTPLLYVREAGYVSAEKYSHSLDTTKQVIRRHASGHLPRPRMLAHLAFADAKKAIYALAERTGQADRVLALRSRGLSPADLQHHYRVLAAIQATPIPGMD